MRFARTSLGMIPDWQFSMDPAINPKLNPNAYMPEGMSQTTIQPVGAYFQGSRLGFTMTSGQKTAAAVVGVLGAAALGWRFLGGKRRRRR